MLCHNRKIKIQNRKPYFKDIDVKPMNNRRNEKWE